MSKSTTSKTAVIHMNTVRISLGQIAFEEYSSAMLGKTHGGKEIPQWFDLSQKVQDAWEASAKKIVEMYNQGVK